MIILDTNVISELMKIEPAAKVFGWVDRLPLNEVFTTAVSQAEVLFGIAAMPAGRRRQQLEDRAIRMFEQHFRGLILPFDETAAQPYADIVVRRRRAGTPIDKFDAQIAAIATSRRMTVATRDVGDFENCGIHVVNPWTA
jgi:predicted nucleic acid-binding protein